MKSNINHVIKNSLNILVTGINDKSNTTIDMLGLNKLSPNTLIFTFTF